MINLGEQVQMQYGKRVGLRATVTRAFAYVQSQKVMFQLTFKDGHTLWAERSSFDTDEAAEERRTNLFKLIGQAFADEHQQIEEDE
jgi:hypothetical protein|tara:strand:- start:2696 stop:2953 length:258 start_codon:yes stop_codon:yes gene_type:complete